MTLQVVLKPASSLKRQLVFPLGSVFSISKLELKVAKVYN